MNGAGRGTRGDLIDRVLEGKDPDTKARVLDLIYRLRLEPTDELFLFCIAIGYLETIITDAPEQWEAVFANFRANLEQWKTNHLRTLETSGHLAEQVERMTHTLTQQTAHTSDLAKGLRAMLRQSESTTEQLPSLAQMLKLSSKKLDALSETSEEQSQQLKREIRRLAETIRDTEKTSTAPVQPPTMNSGSWTPGKMFPTPFPMSGETPSTPISSASRAVSVALTLLLVITGSNLWLLWKQQQVTGWLLYKANRQECRSGVVSRQSAQCSQF